jgi:endonuclease/exonuclease/phosphatase family metal-dependent hydrolase
MPTPSEPKIVQVRSLARVKAIGRTSVSRKASERRRRSDPDTSPANRLTRPATNGFPDAGFDHCFLKTLGRPVAHALTRSQASDHQPIVVEISRNP